MNTCPPDPTARKCGRCARIVLIFGIVEAVLFLVLKVTLGMATGSRALVAASLYSVQDLFSSTAALLGLEVSSKPADKSHPYGHGKVEFLVVAMTSLMILLGVVSLAVTALSSFFGDVAAAEPPEMLAVWIALLCGVTCWLLSRSQACAGRRLQSPALLSCATHMHSDYLASVAVIVSVIGARLGYPALDHVVAVLEAVHVVLISGRMLGTAVRGLMDSSSAPEVIEGVHRAAAEVEGVTSVSRALARWSGQTLLTQVDVEVDGEVAVERADEIRERIRMAVRSRTGVRSETLVRISPAPAAALAVVAKGGSVV